MEASSKCHGCFHLYFLSNVSFKNVICFFQKLVEYSGSRLWCRCTHAPPQSHNGIWTRYTPLKIWNIAIVTGQTASGSLLVIGLLDKAKPAQSLPLSPSFNQITNNRHRKISKLEKRNEDVGYIKTQAEPSEPRQSDCVCPAAKQMSDESW